MANISYRAASSMTNRYGYNGGNEYEDEGELNYSNTFYRKYDAQIGRFTGVDMLAENTSSLTPYNFGNGNPILFSDPTGAVNTINPASFSNASQLINYIIGHGINGFEYEFNRWTFGESTGGGGGGVTSYSFGNNFSLGTNKNGESVVRFSFTTRYSNGDAKARFIDPKLGGGETKNLDCIGFGTASIKVQSLWSHAMGWGETHRDAYINWYGGNQKYDVMWRHNYDGFLKRKYSGQSLSQSGDRESYTESLAAMQGRYAREQDAKNFELGFVGVLAAPFAIYGLAEAGVAAAYSSAISETALLETYSTAALRSIFSPNGSAVIMRSVFEQGLNYAQVQALGATSTMLQAYRVGAFNKLAEYVTQGRITPGIQTQIDRIGEITKWIGF